MPGYNYTAIAAAETPSVVGEFFVQTVPVNDQGVVIQQAQPGRPGYGWQALWHQTDSPQCQWHRATPPSSQRSFSTEDGAHCAARAEIESEIGRFGSGVPVFLFPAS